METLSIQEVADKTGIKAHTLRYYETEGLLFNVERSESGKRRYSAENLEWLEVITCLKDSGLTINEIKTYIPLFKKGKESYLERAMLFKNRQIEIEKKIKQLQHQLETATYKAWYYQNIDKYGDENDPLNCLKMRQKYNDINRASEIRDRTYL